MNRWAQNIENIWSINKIISDFNYIFYETKHEKKHHRAYFHNFLLRSYELKAKRQTYFSIQESYQFAIELPVILFYSC